MGSRISSMTSSVLTAFYCRYRRLTSREWVLWTIAYSFAWIMLSIRTYFDESSTNPDYALYQALIEEFAWVFCFGVLSPLISIICHHWSIERSQIIATSVKLALFYFPFKTLYLTLVIGCQFVLYWCFTSQVYSPESLMFLYIFQIADASPIYIAAIFITYSLIYLQTAQREKLNAAKLETELQRSQLEVLRNQLQPHFLFNTLNLISGTMYVDVDKADSIVARLGDLLRYSLTTEHKPLVALKEEMHVMQSYLDIAELRLGDRLKVEVDLDAETEQLLIPAMMLQPLLENAVKYGVEPSPQASYIRVKSSLNGNTLIITIVNPLFNIEDQRSHGIGLQNAANRLALLFNNAASISLTYSENEVQVLLVLPVIFKDSLNDLSR